MKHEISEDRKRLTIKVTPKEQFDLRWMEDIQSDRAMVEFLEPLTCNSELEWIYPGETDDLTAAPMLGVRFFNNETREETVPERWAFPFYATRSVLEDLRDRGECVFVS